MEHSKNRVLLIYPESDTEELSLMPLSLLHIARPLIENKISVEIIDQRFEKDFFKTLENAINEEIICIGISCITGTQIKRVKKIAEFIKQKTSIPIVLGGPHPTLLPEQTLKSKLIDYLVTGNGEAPFLQLVKSIRDSTPVTEIPQVGSNDGGIIKLNTDKAEIINNGEIPYHLVEKYNRTTVIPIITSYGCPYNCSFCVEKVLHPKYSTLPVNQVVNMIEKALELKPELIDFLDDNFLTNKQRVLEILSLCEHKKLNFKWLCLGRVDTLMSFDDEFLASLKSCGLQSIFFGIESGSDRMLKLTNKMITPEMVLKLNLRLKKIGIRPQYSFMVGFPTETESDRDLTFKLIRLLKKSNPDASIWKVNKYTPYPHTPLFELAVKNGFKPPERFEDWGNIHFYLEEYSIPYDMKI